MNIEGFGNLWSVEKRHVSDEDSEGPVIKEFFFSALWM